MRVLVGCEESGVVRDAFTKRGHDAISCDLEPTRSPGKHHIGDVVAYLMLVPDGYFDLIIIHPDCTKLTVAGNRHYGKGKARHFERVSAAIWTDGLWCLCKKKAKRVCLENPVSVLGSMTNIPKPQYIHPWQFGHKEMKKTALHLHNLPELIPTDIVGPPPKDKEERKKWERVFRMAPGPNRARDRSETYRGVADAFSDQWGAL